MTNPLEIIGPIMIGPSSSHTVGALRLARAASLIVKDFDKVNITLYGSFAETGGGHGTDKAILAGLLGLNVEDERIKNIEKLLKEKKVKDFESVKITLYGSFAETGGGHGTDKAILAGLLGLNVEDERIKNIEKILKEKKVKWKYTFKNGELKQGMHPNTVRFQFIDGKKMEIEGESIGGGEVRLTEIDGIKVSISLKKPTMVLKHKGEAETLSKIMNKIFDYGINIYTVKSWMEDERGLPVTIIEFEQEITKDLVNSINKMEEVTWARFIETDWVGFA